MEKVQDFQMLWLLTYQTSPSSGYILDRIKTWFSHLSPIQNSKL